MKGAALALAAAAALAALSGVPYAAAPAGQARIRLSWRATGAEVRECRPLTPQELARLPVHMRERERCERRLLPYRLSVALDGRTVLDEPVRAGGARDDRPLYVFRELAVTPGRHHLAVRFERARGDESGDAAEARGTPPLLTLDEVVVLGDRAVVLVTYDATHRRLRLLAAPPRGP